MKWCWREKAFGKVCACSDRNSVGVQKCSCLCFSTFVRTFGHHESCLDAQLQVNWAIDRCDVIVHCSFVVIVEHDERDDPWSKLWSVVGSF